MPALPSVA
jgi:hypothetical protein